MYHAVFRKLLNPVILFQNDYQYLMEQVQVFSRIQSGKWCIKCCESIIVRSSQMR